MATLVPVPTGVERPRSGGRRALGGRLTGPSLLAASLLVVATYAVFAHGAIQPPAEPRIQVALEFVAACAAAVWLGTGGLRLAAPRAAWAGISLLAAFAVWSAISLAWSVAPDATWVEFDRVSTYVLVLVLAVAVGASLPRALAAVTGGFLVLIGLVTLYALAQKLIPGLHIGQIVDFNQTGQVARLQEPLGYWNALGLLLVMGAPGALAVVTHAGAPRAARLASLVLLQTILVAGAFTYSRGGLLALFVGLTAFLALCDRPLPGLVLLAAAAVTALPPVVLGLTSHALSADHVPLGPREHAGLLLFVALAGCAVVLVLGGERLLTRELPPDLSPRGRAFARRGAAVLVGAVVIGAAGATILSSRGLTGTISHAWSSFTSPQAISVSNPNRIFSADSANRWAWWQEALGAFSDRPLGGWGAGSFPVVHLLYRHDTLPVTHAHSAPLEWLAETGLVGGALAIAGWVLLLRAGLRGVRRRPLLSRDRGLAAASLAAVAAYSVHALYDWDWDIPGVTLPALILLGVLTASARQRTAAALAPLVPVRFEAGPGLRLLAVAAATLALCILGLSSVLPNVASGRVSAAEVAAAGSSLAALRSAQHDAAVAARLDPLSDAGPTAEATVALHARAFSRARAYLLQAVNREPTDATAWEELAELDIATGHLDSALVAAQRVVELNPYDAAAVFAAVRTAQQAELGIAPARASATARPTP